VDLIGLLNKGAISKKQVEENICIINQSEECLIYKELSIPAQQRFCCVGILFLSLLFSLLFITSLVKAQEIPPGQEAGPQAERFKSRAEEAKERFEGKKAKPPEIELEKEEEKKPAVETISFSLKEIKITGATIFKPEEFLPLYQPYLDKQITFADLGLIAQKIKDKYKENGFLTTTVYIPEQEIKDGSVEIRVAEGKMGSLGIEGNRWFKSPLIEKYFHTKKNEIININKVQRDILRLNQNPDIEVKTVIAAGEQPETSDVTLKIKDKFPWHTGIGFDNQGTRLTGKLRSAQYFRSANATGAGDSLFLNTVYSTLTLGESLSYTIPISTYGTKFSFDATYFKMKIGKEFKASEISGVTQIYTPHISWELALSELFTANANAGMEIKAIKKRTEETVTSNDQLRTPYFSFDFSEIDNFGETSFSPKFNFGTEDFLGASERGHPTATRAKTGGFFFKYEQSLRRIQRMPFKSYLSIDSRFQATSHTLPSSEQIQLGGENSIRGYPEGDYLADIGASLRLDWNFPSGWTNSALKIPKSCRIEPLVFTDLGYGKLKKILSGERKNKFLMGVGGGFKLRLYNKVFLKLEWAKRIGGGHPSSGSGPSTMHITFQSEL
jgi:hemolysin activation/secretion protein